jgi:hypothetical protein
MGGGALYRWYLLSLLYVLAVLINWLACMMLFIARWEGAQHSWLSDVKGRDLTHAPRSQKYMAACYWQLISTLTVGYGEEGGKDSDYDGPLHAAQCGVVFTCLPKPCK